MTVLVIMTARGAQEQETRVTTRRPPHGNASLHCQGSNMMMDDNGEEGGAS